MKMVGEIPYDWSSDEEEKVPDKDKNDESDQKLKAPADPLPPIKLSGQRKHEENDRNGESKEWRKYKRPISPSRYDID